MSLKDMHNSMAAATASGRNGDEEGTKVWEVELVPEVLPGVFDYR